MFISKLEFGAFYDRKICNVCFSGIISDACDEDSDCSDAVPESLCTSGTCSCLSGYRSSVSGDQCIKRELSRTKFYITKRIEHFHDRNVYCIDFSIIVSDTSDEDIDCYNVLQSYCPTRIISMCKW